MRCTSVTQAGEDTVDHSSDGQHDDATVFLPSTCVLALCLLALCLVAECLQRKCTKPSAEFSLLAAKHVTCGRSSVLLQCTCKIKTAGPAVVIEHTAASAQAKLWFHKALSSECRQPHILTLHVHH